MNIKKSLKFAICCYKILIFDTIQIMNIDYIKELTFENMLYKVRNRAARLVRKNEPTDSNAMKEYLDVFKSFCVSIVNNHMYYKFKAYYNSYRNTNIGHAHPPLIECLDIIGINITDELRFLLVNEKLNLLLEYNIIDINLFKFYTTNVITALNKYCITFNVTCKILAILLGRHDSTFSAITQNIYGRILTDILYEPSIKTLYQFKEAVDKEFDIIGYNQIHDVLEANILERIRKINESKNTKQQKRAHISYELINKYAQHQQTISLNDNQSHVEVQLSKPLEVQSSKPKEINFNPNLEVQPSEHLEVQPSKPIENQLSKPLEVQLSKPKEINFNPNLEVPPLKPLEVQIQANQQIDKNDTDEMIKIAFEHAANDMPEIEYEEYEDKIIYDNDDLYDFDL